MSASSVLEYARYHGLASNHRSENIVRSVLGGYTHNSRYESAEETTPPLYPDFSSLVPPLEEPKLQLSRTVGTLLSSSVRPPEFFLLWDDFLPDTHRKKKLKLELPLLPTDHHEDVAAVKYGVRQALD